ncbi:MAG TPA: hypothetical protein VMV77_12745 [Bacteroidales bacterium]|nr:hypothetical protein [archaeon]HUX57838.1 hypothetical protein [Bacteroidales bacterium]
MSDISVNLTISSGITANISVGANPSPAGSDKEIQYNDGGARGADDANTWDKSTHTHRVGTDSQDAVERITGKAYVDPEAVTFADPLNCDCTKSNNHTATLTGSTTINLTNLSAGMSGVIVLLNDGAGGHTLTMGAAFTKELNGSDTYDDTADKYNLISWYYDGTNVFYTICNEA